MMTGAAARYVFAACLCASVVDLMVIDLVVGPLAFAAAPSASPSTAASAPPLPATASPDTPTPAPTPTPPTPRAGAVLPPTKVVARFDSDQPNGDDADLRALATAMIADPSARIVLEGHSDQRGDPDKNQTLSLERATWARSRLVELGVSPSRIAVVGLGSERPLDTTDDDAAIASNRRVEARWLSASPSAEAGDR